jgi:hypothetical protein
MKKQFNLTDPKLAPARQVDAVKHEISKYVARERRKKLDATFDFWDFDCKIGADAENAKAIHLSEINKSIDELVTLESEKFYLEILAKPMRRMKTKS